MFRTPKEENGGTPAKQRGLMLIARPLSALGLQVARNKSLSREVLPE